MRITTFTSILLAAIFIAGCSDDDKDNWIGLNGPVVISATIEPFSPEGPTRVALSGNDLVWETNDRIGVFYTPSSGTAASNVPFQLTELSDNNRTGAFVSASYLRWDETSREHTLRAIYPYREGNTNLNSLIIDIPATQSYQPAAQGLSSYMLISEESFTTLDDRLSMTFRTPLAVTALNVDASGTAFASEKISRISIGTETPIAGQVTYNFPDDNFGDASSSAVSAVISGNQTVSGTYYVSTVPADLTGSEITVSIVTEAGEYFNATVPGIALVGGKVNEININLSSLIGSGDGQIVDIDGGLYNPNSYLIAPGQSISIPVIKAYSVWKLDPDIQTTISGEPSVEVIWLDSPNGLSASSVLSSVRLVTGASGPSATINVTAGSETGNALIAYKLDDQIRWSWHIWVSDYDPANGGRTYIYNNGTVTNEFMDRNIGALNTNEYDAAASGMMYQWGRKDPFPGPEGEYMPSAVEWSRPIYGPGGNELAIGGDGWKSVAVARNNNLTRTIEMPLHYYVNGTTANWLSNKDVYRTDLWSNEPEVKGVYDPCPDGWRVPISGDMEEHFPWYGLDPLPEGNEDNPSIEPGKGYYSDKVGFYPAAGERYDSQGTFWYTGTLCGAWTAALIPHDLDPDYLVAVALNVFTNPGIITPWDSGTASGLPVRCVRDVRD